MTQRGRTRNAGAIDSRIADTVYPPLAIPWVTGRFYDGSVQIGAYNTSTMGTAIYAVPILVPHPVTVTSIGVESTVASSAGFFLRLAIYNSDPVSCLPNIRLVDSGLIASDAAAGFLSAVVSVVLQAGWHWLVGANYATPTTVTVRTHGNGQTSIGAFQVSSFDTPSVTPCQGIRIASSSQVVNVGFPYNFFRGAYGTQSVLLESASTQYPRIMIGV